MVVAVRIRKWQTKAWMLFDRVFNCIQFTLKLGPFTPRNVGLSTSYWPISRMLHPALCGVALSPVGTFYHHGNLKCHSVIHSIVHCSLISRSRSPLLLLNNGQFIFKGRRKSCWSCGTSKIPYHSYKSQYHSSSFSHKCTSHAHSRSTSPTQSNLRTSLKQQVRAC